MTDTDKTNKQLMEEIETLPQKVAELERERTGRKKAEERAEHLTLVLRAVRNVNQLITKEKDREKLLKGACDNLTGTRGYYNAWISLLDESGKLVAHAESGLGKDFLPLLDRLKGGRLTACGQRALKQPEAVVTEDPVSTCTDCPLSSNYAGRSAATARLEYEGKVYGFLTVSLPSEMATDVAELGLFHEMATDIALALYNIELEEQSKQKEHNLAERMKELGCLYGIAKIVEMLGITLAELYQEVVKILPASWQYSEITCAKISIGDKEFKTENYRESDWKQLSDIKVHGKKAGIVAVCYLEEKPELDEGPFMKEERLLIDAVAERLGRITERRQAEKALKNSEKQYHDLLDNANDLIQFVGTDTRIQFVNRKWLETLEYSEEEVKNLKVTDIIPENQIAHIMKSFKGAANGETVSSIETTLISKYGKAINVEGNGSGLFEDGVFIGAIGIFRDITERKQAEEILRQSEEKLRLMFESVTEGITITDLNGNIVSVNEATARTHGFDSGQQLIGRSAFELIAERDHAKAIENLKKTLEKGYSGTLEYTLVREDGSEFPGELSASLIKDASGNPDGFVAITRDITERKHMEEQLIITDRLASIGELASGIAHELNNPLTGVIGLSQLLVERNVPEEIREDLKLVNSEAQRAADVVRGMLAFARKHPPAKQLINVNDVIGTVLDLRAYEQRVSNIERVTNLAPDLPQIWADYFQLQQVVLNIVTNAEHFMLEAHRKGTLAITTERVEDIVRISFTDDGPGITEKDLGHVFDPFFTTKEVGKGTGLGLSISYGIVTAHGGRLYAESEQGKGATFIVELPIREEEGSHAKRH